MQDKAIITAIDDIKIGGGAKAKTFCKKGDKLEIKPYNDANMYIVKNVITKEKYILKKERLGL